MEANIEHQSKKKIKKQKKIKTSYMILLLYDDLIQHICKFLNIKSLIFFLATRSDIKNILDDVFFKNFANQLYGADFWYKAEQRSPKKSNPLPTYYLEILRIEKFQAKLYELELKRWQQNDFYKYWQGENISSNPN